MTIAHIVLLGFATWIALGYVAATRVPARIILRICGSGGR